MMLAGAAKRVVGEGKWRWGEVEGVLVDNFADRLSGLKHELVCHFKLVTDMVRDGIREFVNDADTPTFLKRKLVGFDMVGTGRSELKIAHLDQCPFMHFTVY